MKAGAAASATTGFSRVMRVGLALLLAICASKFTSATAAQLALKVLSTQLPQSGNGWLRVAVTETATGETAPRDSVVVLDSVNDVKTAHVRLWRNEDGTFGAEFFQLQKQLGTYRCALFTQQSLAIAVDQPCLMTHSLSAVVSSRSWLRSQRIYRGLV